MRTDRMLPIRVPPVFGSHGGQKRGLHPPGKGVMDTRALLCG